MERRQSEAPSQTPVHNHTGIPRADPHNTQGTEMPILNDNPQFSERNQLCCSCGNCLQFPPTTTPYSPRGKANHGTRNWSTPVPTGGEAAAGGSGAGFARPGPGAAPAATSHRPAAPAGNLPPTAPYRKPARPTANPPTSPNSGTKTQFNFCTKAKERGSVRPPRREGASGETSEVANREPAAAGAAPQPALPRTAAAQGPGAARAGMEGQRDEGRAAARPAGDEFLPPSPPNRPPHSFACRRAVT